MSIAPEGIAPEGIAPESPSIPGRLSRQLTDKAETYRQLQAELEAVLAGLEDPIAAMASFTSVVKERLPYASWVGFYRVVAPELLRVGPYQGPVACIEIPFSRGVCGAAARERRGLVVEDVHAFPGHIACDGRARSEVVVPVLDAAGELVAVLDLDSHAPAAFDNTDREGLEQALEILRPCLG